METTLAGILALLAAAAALEVHRDAGHRPPATLAVTLLLAVLSRPDLVTFGAVLLLGTAWQLHRRGQPTVLKRLVAWSTGALILPGVVFFLWRWSYFGYPFPNPFYIKWAGAATDAALVDMLTFLAFVVGPLTLVALVHAGKRDGRARRVLSRGGAPVGAAVVAGLLVSLAIQPIQGFLWRFLMPVLAPGLLVLALLARRLPLAPGGGRGRSMASGHPVAAVLLVVALLLFPLNTHPAASQAYETRHQGDRVMAGKALAPFAGQGYRMFVTESGAVPYYSGWHAVDNLGLNSEHIAHQGLNASFLAAYEPDLILIATDLEENFVRHKDAAIAEYLQESDHELIAAVYRWLSPTGFHVYFLDPNVPHYQGITCALMTQDGIFLGDPHAFAAMAGVQVNVTSLSPEACGKRLPPDLGGDTGP